MNSQNDHGSPEQERGARIHRVIEECVRRRADGEVVSDASVMAAHPDLLPELAEELGKLRLITAARQRADECAGHALSDGFHIRCPHCQHRIALVEDAMLESITCPSCGRNFSILADDTNARDDSRPQDVERSELISPVGVGQFGTESMVRDSGLVDNIPDEMVLDKICRYEVRTLLGRGAYGSVYLAYDVELGRQVAIKVQRRQHFSAAGNELFRKEARILADLDHPHIVPVYDTGQVDDGRRYVVSKLIDGTNLAEKLARQRLSFGETATLLATVAEALHYAHRKKLVHRDIKPANILLDSSGKPYVTDFGLALSEDDFGDRSIPQGGTTLYMSPEQARREGHRIDGRSDIFSLGVVMYEILTGERPFAGPTASEILDRIKTVEARPPRMLDDTIPKELERICLKALAKRTTERYNTALDIAEDLRHFVAAEPTAQDSAEHQFHGVKDRLRSFDDMVPPSSDAHRELPANPYMGLEAYSEEDTHLFFGRDEQIERLWNSFRELHTEQTIQSDTPRILPIIGPSGCGKSSLTRAGLIAELKRRPLPGRGNMRVVVITPGSHPLESLAAAFARMVTNDPSPIAKTREFEQQFRIKSSKDEYDGLRRITDLLPEPQLPILLLIDQFEELYSLCAEAAERLAFIESLVVAATDRSARVSVVLTLRSDFLGQTQVHPRLNSLVSEKGLLVPAMSESELRLAIGEPAAQAGHRLEETVIDLLVGETEGREGALPLLQFAMSRIWEGMRAGQAPTETLRQIYGVGGALAGEAQRIHDSLSSEDQRIVRRAFLAMVQLGEGTRDTRRRASLREIATAKDDAGHVHAVLSRFATAGCRLITLQSTADGTGMMEITHEALLAHWPTLKKWLDESREDIRFHRRLDEAARHWDDEKRPDGLLWRSPDLDYLRQFHQRAGTDMTPIQIEFFLEADRTERQHRRRTRRRTRMYQVATAIFGVLLCASVYFAYVSWRNENRADIMSRKAQDAVDEYLLQITDDPLLKHGSEALRLRLLDAARKFYKQIADAEDDRTEARFQRGWAYTKLATITYEIESAEVAEQLQRTGIAEMIKASKATPNNSEFQEKLAAAYRQLGQYIYERGHLFAAESHVRESLRRQEKLIADRPDRRELLKDKAHSHGMLGIIYSDMGKVENAESQLLQGLGILQRLTPREHSHLMDSLSILHHNLGALYASMDKLDAAGQEYAKAVILAAKLAANDNSPMLQCRQAISKHNLGWIQLKLGHVAEAESAFVEALRDIEAVAEKHPNVLDYATKSCTVRESLGILYTRNHRFSEAADSFAKGFSIAQRLENQFPDQISPRGISAELRCHIGHVYYHRREFDAAERELLQSKEYYQQYVDEVVASVDGLKATRRNAIGPLQRLAWVSDDLGRVYAKTNRMSQAVESHHQALDIWTHLGKVCPKLPHHKRSAAISLKYLGQLCYEQQRFLEAIKEFCSSLSIMTQLVNEYPNVPEHKHELANLHSGLALAHYALREYDAAIEELDIEHDIRKQLVASYADDPAYIDGLLKSHAHRAAMNLKLGKIELAISDLEQMVVVSPSSKYAYVWLAYILATTSDDHYRNGMAAVGRATKACELTEWRDWQCLSALAASKAETGDFNEAIRHNQAAIQVASADAKSKLAEDTKLFQSHQCIRDRVDTRMILEVIRDDNVFLN